MSCRVFVEVGCEVDSSLNLRVDRQTGAPLADDGDELLRISPAGRAAVNAALQLPLAEVTAFSLGRDHDEALRHAIAAGAQRAVRLTGEEPWSDAALVSGVAEWLASQRPDLVIMGRHAGQIATRLGWSHLAGLSRLCREDGKISALRQFDRGANEEVSARLPAIVRLQAEATPLRYIARSRLDHARGCPVEEMRLSPAPFSSAAMDAGPLQLSRPRTRLGMAATTPAPAKASDRLGALMSLGARPATKAPAKPAEPTPKTAEELADEVVRYLAHHHLL